MKFLTITVHSAGHGAFERQRRIARALTSVGHNVYWMSPRVDAKGAERHLPTQPVPRWLPGLFGWILTLRTSFRRHREDLKDIDCVFSVREYDALACLSDPVLESIPHVFLQRGDTVECERFLSHYALRWKDRLRAAITALIYPPIQRYVFRRMRHIVVVADFLGTSIRNRIATGLPEMTVLPNDSVIAWHLEHADPAHLTRIRQLKARHGFLVGVVSQIFWKAKGLDLFLSTMTELKDRPGLHAVVIGYGPEMAAVPEYIRAHGLEEKVTFLGRSGAAHELMPLFDLIVVPTRFCDACPNVVLEALEAGPCIIASDIDAHRAQLKHPELLFPNGDRQELARRISLLSADEPARMRNRELARQRKEWFHFDWDGAMVRLLENAAAKPSSQCPRGGDEISDMSKATSYSGTPATRVIG